MNSPTCRISFLHFLCLLLILTPFSGMSAWLNGSVVTERLIDGSSNAKSDVAVVIEQVPGASSADVYVVDKSESKQVACVVNWYNNGKLVQQQGLIHPPLVPQEKRHIGAAASLNTTVQIASAWYP